MNGAQKEAPTERRVGIERSKANVNAVPNLPSLACSASFKEKAKHGLTPSVRLLGQSSNFVPTTWFCPTGGEINRI
jgi:hypothetical protein